jgi:hypothetical protein
MEERLFRVEFNGKEKYVWRTLYIYARDVKSATDKMAELFSDPESVKNVTSHCGADIRGHYIPEDCADLFKQGKYDIEEYSPDKQPMWFEGASY